jgi:hypothetical protein
MIEKDSEEYKKFSEKFDKYWNEHIERLKIIHKKKLNYHQIYDLITFFGFKLNGMTTRDAEKELSTPEKLLSRNKASLDWILGAEIYKDLLNNPTIRNHMELISVTGAIHILEFLLKNNIPITQDIIDELKDTPINFSRFDTE